MSLLRSKSILFLALALCLGLITCGGEPPHTDPPPAPDPKRSVQLQLFSAIEEDDGEKALSLAEANTVELGSAFSFKNYPKMTPLQFALHKKRNFIAHEILSNFGITQLNPFHRSSLGNTVEMLLKVNKAEHKDLSKWLFNLLKSGDAEKVKYLLTDGVTRKILTDDQKTKKLLEKFNYLDRPEKALSTPFGINNSGNSCYANAATQMLMLMPNEYWSLARAKFIDDKDAVAKKLISNKELTFLKTVFDFRDAWSSGAANSIGLRDKLRTLIDTGVDQDIFPDFAGNDKAEQKRGQQDAHEFFGRIVDLIGNTSFPTFIELSVLKNLSGTVVSETRSPPLKDGISPPISVSTTAMALQALIAEFFKTERLSGTDQFTFQGTKIDVDKYLRLTGNSDYLPVLLKRFARDPATGTIKKVEMPFDLGDGKIDLTNFIEPKPSEKQIFQVIGIAMHEGATVSSGHYTAFVKYGEKWFYVNDGAVSVEKTWQEIKPNADALGYLMLFKRVKN